jgi:hypothetical protein
MGGNDGYPANAPGSPYKDPNSTNYVAANKAGRAVSCILIHVQNQLLSLLLLL